MKESQKRGGGCRGEKVEIKPIRVAKSGSVPGPPWEKKMVGEVKRSPREGKGKISRGKKKSHGFSYSRNDQVLCTLKEDDGRTPGGKGGKTGAQKKKEGDPWLKKSTLISVLLRRSGA